jgi:hypothetical protein
MGDSHNGWFIMENPILKLMIWGYPHFRKPPYGKQFQTLLGSAERFMGSLFSTLPQKYLGMWRIRPLAIVRGDILSSKIHPEPTQEPLEATHLGAHTIAEGLLGS